MMFHDASGIDPARALLLVGAIILILVPAGALWALLDHRRVGRERVAIKPTKFALSIAVYLLTASWMLGYVRPDRMSSALVQLSASGLMIGAVVELGCITIQAARGRKSHFNTASGLDAAIAGTMAMMAILFIGMLLPLAWELAQRPRPDVPALMTSGIIIGLVLTFLLGALTGSNMGRAAMQLRAADPHRLASGPRLSHDQLRLAHFLAIHAMQAIPMMTWAALVIGGQAAGPLLAAGTICYVAVDLMLIYRPALVPAWPITVLPSTSRS